MRVRAFGLLRPGSDRPSQAGKLATGLRLNPPCSFAQTAIRTFAKLSSKLNFRRPAIGHRCWSPPVFSVLSSSPLPAFQRADRTRYRGRSTDPRRRGTPGLSTVVAFCETLARRRGFPALYGLQNGFPGHSCPIRWGRRHSRIGRARALLSPSPQSAAQPVSFSLARPRDLEGDKIAIQWAECLVYSLTPSGVLAENHPKNRGFGGILRGQKCLRRRFSRRSPVGEWSCGARSMGGVPPLGDRAEDRKLVVMDSEAEIVRAIFRRYAELCSAADRSDGIS